MTVYPTHTKWHNIFELGLYLEEGSEHVRVGVGEQYERHERGEPAVEDRRTNLLNCHLGPLGPRPGKGHEGVAYVGGVVDAEADGDDEDDARHRVQRQAPEVHRADDVNLSTSHWMIVNIEWIFYRHSTAPTSFFNSTVWGIHLNNLPAKEYKAGLWVSGDSNGDDFASSRLVSVLYSRIDTVNGLFLFHW